MTTPHRGFFCVFRHGVQATCTLRYFGDYGRCVFHCNSGKHLRQIQPQKNILPFVAGYHAKPQYGLSGVTLCAAANYLSRYDFLSIAMSSVLPENLLPEASPVSSSGYRSSGSVKLHGKNGNKPATSPKSATLINEAKPLKFSDFATVYNSFPLACFYPPKLSYMMLSGSTPRLSSMPTTAFDMGPGPHM